MHRAAQGPGEEPGLEGGSAEADGRRKGHDQPRESIGTLMVHGEPELREHSEQRQIYQDV